jgi:hypothetical protein
MLNPTYNSAELQGQPNILKVLGFAVLCIMRLEAAIAEYLRSIRCIELRRSTQLLIFYKLVNTCVMAVEAGPPRACRMAVRASGTWFPPACPRNCITASTAW